MNVSFYELLDILDLSVMYFYSLSMWWNFMKGMQLLEYLLQEHCFL